ncbi:biotin synthase auxiliary protein BsaP [Jatrophihabitans sp. DSM 45814]
MTRPDTHRYCGQCGEVEDATHPRCQQRAVLEPPRYCPQCARRMVVQVDPLGWRARCSVHGVLASVPR